MPASWSVALNSLLVFAAANAAGSVLPLGAALNALTAVAMRTTRQLLRIDPRPDSRDARPHAP